VIHSRHVTALLPLQGASDEPRRRNLRPFVGVPLYQHILRTLDKTYAIDEIRINTDSAEIQTEAPKLSRKVRIIPRGEGLRGDDVSMERIIAHDIGVAETDIVIQTHATNPLVRTDTLAKALKSFVVDEEYDSLFSVTEYHRRFYDAAGKPVNHDPANLIRQRDLPPLFEDNCCFYIFTGESFEASRSRIGKAPIMFPIPRIEAIDIDNEFTFRLAELLAGYAAHMETD